MSTTSTYRSPLVARYASPAMAELFGDEARTVKLPLPRNGVMVEARDLDGDERADLLVRYGPADGAERLGETEVCGVRIRDDKHAGRVLVESVDDPGSLRPADRRQPDAAIEQALPAELAVADEWLASREA